MCHVPLFPCHFNRLFKLMNLPFFLFSHPTNTLLTLFSFSLLRILIRPILLIFPTFHLPLSILLTQVMALSTTQVMAQLVYTAQVLVQQPCSDFVAQFDPLDI